MCFGHHLVRKMCCLRLDSRCWRACLRSDVAVGCIKGTVNNGLFVLGRFGKSCAELTGLGNDVVESCDC